MATRNGKIAHLAFQIREELNIRLCNGEPGNKLVDWLNGNPAVIEVLNTYFSGRPVSEQNLSEWRNGGYQQWATLNACLGETTALSESAGLIVENGIDTGDLLLVICAHYAGMIQRWNLMPPEDLDRMMNIFRNLTNAVLAVRRSEQRDARLEIDRERLELLREKQGNKSASSSSSPESSSAGSSAAPRSACASDDPPSEDRSPDPQGARSGRSQRAAEAVAAPDTRFPVASEPERQSAPGLPPTSNSLSESAPARATGAMEAPKAPAAPVASPVRPSSLSGAPSNGTPRNPRGLL